MAPSSSGDRKEFGRRLKAVRLALGYTQEQMAYSLGINLARYSKYEIGRSEPPHEILCRIADIADADLNYLITGQKRSQNELLPDQLDNVLQALPIAAVVYDKHRRLIAYNTRYRELFSPHYPKSLLRRGTPQDVLIRAWAHANKLDPADVEACVQARLDPKRYARNPVELLIGPKRLYIAETTEANKRLVLITDMTESDKQSI